MKYRKLDANGDYTFGTGNDFYEGTVAVSQAIKTNLLLLSGEWWESTDEGLPLFQNILGQSGAPDHVQAADLLAQGVISQTQGVISISNYTSSYDSNSRKYSATCTVQTQYGDATVEVTF